MEFEERLEEADAGPRRMFKLTAVAGKFKAMTPGGSDSYLMIEGYMNRTAPMDLGGQVVESAMMRSILVGVRDELVTLGVAEDRMMVLSPYQYLTGWARTVRITAHRGAKPKQMPGALPMTPATGPNGDDDDARAKLAVTIEPDYDKKKGQFENKIQVEVELKTRDIVPKVIDKITFTMKSDGSTIEEAGIEAAFKAKLKKALLFNELKNLTLGIKVSGTIQDDDETPQKKLEKLKGKLKVVLGVDVRAINGRIEATLFVDSAGGVGAAVQVTIPW